MSEATTVGVGIDVFIYGTPAPQGSKRHVGHGVLVESSALVKPWREAVVAQVRPLLVGTPPMAGAMCVEAVFYLKRPKSEPHAVYSAKRPDGDKLMRSTLDALTTAGVYHDDGQVACGHFETRYVCDEQPTPGAYVHVEPLS